MPKLWTSQTKKSETLPWFPEIGPPSSYLRIVFKVVVKAYVWSWQPTRRHARPSFPVSINRTSNLSFSSYFPLLFLPSSLLSSFPSSFLPLFFLSPFHSDSSAYDVFLYVDKIYIDHGIKAHPSYSIQLYFFRIIDSHVRVSNYHW